MLLKTKLGKFVPWICVFIVYMLETLIFNSSQHHVNSKWNTRIITWLLRTACTPSFRIQRFIVLLVIQFNLFNAPGNSLHILWRILKTTLQIVEWLLSLKYPSPRQEDLMRMCGLFLAGQLLARQTARTIATERTITTMSINQSFRTINFDPDSNFNT